MKFSALLLASSALLVANNVVVGQQMKADITWAESGASFNVGDQTYEASCDNIFMFALDKNDAASSSDLVSCNAWSSEDPSMATAYTGIAWMCTAADATAAATFTDPIPYNQLCTAQFEDTAAVQYDFQCYHYVPLNTQYVTRFTSKTCDGGNVTYEYTKLVMGTSYAMTTDEAGVNADALLFALNATAMPSVGPAPAEATASGAPCTLTQVWAMAATAVASLFLLAA